MGSTSNLSLKGDLAERGLLGELEHDRAFTAVNGFDVFRKTLPISFKCKVCGRLLGEEIC